MRLYSLEIYCWERVRFSRTITAVCSDGEDKEFTDHLERELAQHFALAALQVQYFQLLTWRCER